MKVREGDSESGSSCNFVAWGEIKNTAVPRLKFCGIYAEQEKYRLRSKKRHRQASPEKVEVWSLKISPRPAPLGTSAKPVAKPRYKLVVDINIHSESCGLLKGRTMDISEIGIAAVLGDDVPVGGSREVKTLRFRPVQ